MTILHITSSVTPATSKSAVLGTEVVEKLGSPVTTRDTSDIPAITRIGSPQTSPPPTNAARSRPK